ncbi:hypothetical protein [Microbacterium dauci]|uniref:DUF4352 domain-containing protein n=1 Tax=Microbacterium dauci TaxID=3048008 RepID=A0ABT6ZAE9_9MICO|nr:hypothetical protein [Microbacterium sp. LX3-4]MDJ1113141.1 hypothetical protein [Microbacterium sp. LX3-4]
MKPRLVWSIGVGLLAVAWIVVAITPVEADAERPFAVAASVDEPATARTFTVTLSNMRLGAAATDPRGWTAEGTWLLVDIEAEARREEARVALRSAWLELDGIRYRASERPQSFLGTALAVGLPKSGTLAFELPGDIADAKGVIELATVTETRLDAIVTLPVDFGALERQQTVELAPTEWAR